MKRLAIRSCLRLSPNLPAFLPVVRAPSSTLPTICSRRLIASTSYRSNDISSGRSLFKQTPVHPSILSYIQHVGVGKPQRTKRRKHRRNKEDSKFLTEREEKEELRSARRPQSTWPPPPFPAPNRNEKTEAGKSIRRFPVKLIASVGRSEDAFPTPLPLIPEVAIAGRSNVGKSTLLNALLHGIARNATDDEQEDAPSSSRLGHRRRRPTYRTAKLPKGLKAATSAKPGETREISFYQLSSKVNDAKVSMVLVDLPGYGFAFASEEKAKEWQSLMKAYIIGRGKSLKRILLLIDARHGLKKTDVEFLESMQQSLMEGDDSAADLKRGAVVTKKRELPPIQLVLTKCDLVSQADLARRVALVRQQLSDSLRRQPSALPIMLVSAQMEGQAGVLELQQELAALVPHSR